MRLHLRANKMKLQEDSTLAFKKKLVPMTSILGFDYGLKRIGVAVSDMGGMIATSLATIGGFDELDKIMKERVISGFVVGLPRQMDGSEGEQAAITRKWAEKLSERYNLPVLFWDERLSSRAVSHVLTGTRKKQKAAIDKSAAAYILQGALDRLALLS